jgi:hypothetical protein
VAPDGNGAVVELKTDVGDQSVIGPPLTELPVYGADPWVRALGRAIYGEAERFDDTHDLNHTHE